ncbi:MAG: GNAT family N-acetyltransferase [Acidimicrobiia bacterium]|nr:GNAT family N-acetyltransferase [Acidimicrobiia bacterium]
MVALPDVPAYLSDMFTATWARRQGLGTLLLQCAGELARRSGCREMILVPSRQTREDRFYATRGFKDVAPLSLLIPTAE